MARAAFRLLTAALLIALALSGPARASELRLGVLSEVTALDPHYYQLTSNIDVDMLVYRTLVKHDLSHKVVPDLALSWRAIDDLHWEFQLRPDATWQDGSAVTADDVVFIFQRAKTVPPSPFGNIQPYIQHVMNVSATVDHTVVIETDRPHAILLHNLLNVWITSRQYGAHASMADDNSGKAAIGSGPYRVVSWHPGDRMIPERQDGYFGPKPDWDWVIYHPIPSDAAHVTALLSGDVDLIGDVPSDDVANLRENPAIHVSSLPSTRIYSWALDTSRDSSPEVTDADAKPLEHNPRRDVRVRRTMSMAIDRDALVSPAMQGQAIPSAQFIPLLFPTTSWAMRSGITYDGYLQETTVASMAHPVEVGVARRLRYRDRT